MRHPAKIVPLIGTIDPNHIIEDAAAARIHLSVEDWYTLLASAASVKARILR
jgi:predicted oxidoreductase